VRGQREETETREINDRAGRSIDNGQAEHSWRCGGVGPRHRGAGEGDLEHGEEGSGGGGARRRRCREAVGEEVDGMVPARPEEQGASAPPRRRSWRRGIIVVFQLIVPLIHL
jgi:hypothetical protein